MREAVREAPRTLPHTPHEDSDCRKVWGKGVESGCCCWCLNAETTLFILNASPSAACMGVGERGASHSGWGLSQTSLIDSCEVADHASQCTITGRCLFSHPSCRLVPFPPSPTTMRWVSSAPASPLQSNDDVSCVWCVCAARWHTGGLQGEGAPPQLAGSRRRFACRPAAHSGPKGGYSWCECASLCLHYASTQYTA